ncbi:MAG TPA: DUF2157 domain-containing protein [Steroidobacteraceae bacterium]|nr:DUF2157 domain-containing protein [Steroidobacteraceae bacterium]
MSEGWPSALKRWQGAGLVDAATAERIRAFESSQGGVERQGRLTLIAFSLGAVLLAAGILLFVAAHWDRMSPGGRFALVLALIAILHAGGAVASRSSTGLSATLHAVGTAAFGAGIYLAGQVFHMAEHWPAALMLWSLGAAVGVVLLRQWPQVVWLAVLVPAWLWGEWTAALPPHAVWRGLTPVAVGMFLLACAYLMARPAASTERWRRALAWLGAIGLIPAAVALAMSSDVDWTMFGAQYPAVTGAPRIVGWSVAIALPLGLAWYLRGRDAVWLLAALAWALVLMQVSPRSDAGELAMFALLALGAVGIVLWGLRDQQRLAINVGVLGFACSVLGFYFSSLYDKLGRALGLIGIGVLFIGGGWLLERARRRLIARLQSGRP